MSSDLKNTATISADAGFRSRVLAAMVEHGSTVLLEPPADLVTDAVNKSLARAILYNPTQYQAVFSALAADDAGISANTDPSAVTDDALRTVVAAIWTNVGVVVSPGLR